MGSATVCLRALRNAHVPGYLLPSPWNFLENSHLCSKRACSLSQRPFVEANLDRYVMFPTTRNALPRDERHHPQRDHALLLFLLRNLRSA